MFELRTIFNGVSKVIWDFFGSPLIRFMLFGKASKAISGENFSVFLHARFRCNHPSAQSSLFACYRTPCLQGPFVDWH